MKKLSRDLFYTSAQLSKPLFIFEMANNHMGNALHGLKIIREFAEVVKNFDFNFAIKFQYRDLETFIHPDFQKRTDLKYVKRFWETRLKEKDFLKLKKEAEKQGFLTICTPFDEKSVDLVQKHGYQILKIGSPSITDWPLLERIARSDLPIIASVGGAKREEIDAVVTFFRNRQKSLALMHCVSEYPTKEENLHLSRISYLKNKYPDLVIGYSTHEDPERILPVQLAVAKGAMIFERHVGLSSTFAMNAYSSTPSQVAKWLEAAQKAMILCGLETDFERGQKEKEDLRQFQRGVFAREEIRKGEKIRPEQVFLAFPNKPRQMLACDLSKYKHSYARQNFKAKEAVCGVKTIDFKKKITAITNGILKILNNSGIHVPDKVSLEISHHYGLENFYRYGLCMLTYQNKKYCRKLMVMFPGQIHPVQYHQKKKEIFRVLSGEFTIILNEKKQLCKKGETIVVNPMIRHSFSTKTGGVIDEVSLYHSNGDSIYLDRKIMENQNRKTVVEYWKNLLK